jgi:PKD repeat protein
MVGEPVSFAVSPFDVFSLGATRWTFGDGSPAASGNAVSHTYAAPGTYPVTVSSLDGSGNESTQTASIAIAAKPTPPPPPPPPGKIKLSLRLETTSLKQLLRSGGLTIFTSVNEPAWLTLRGRARVRVRGANGPRVKLVPIFRTKTATFTAAGGREVKLRLSGRGRALLRDRTKVRVLITGMATNVAGETASKTRSQALRR